MSEPMEIQAKRAKITDFWANGKYFNVLFCLTPNYLVSTRKKSDISESWKLIHETVLSKVYGPALVNEKSYKIFAFDLVRIPFYNFNYFRKIG